MTAAQSKPLCVPGTDWNCRNGFLELIPPKEFSFTATLAYMMRSPNECMYHVENNTVTKLVPCGDQHVLVQVTGSPGGGSGPLSITFADSVALPEPSVLAAVADYVWDWFDLGRDLRPFYETARQDPLLAQAVNDFYGLRIVGIHDLFEAMCWGIIGQQINLAFAYTLKRRFVEAFGQSVQWNGRSYRLFPTPEAIAGLDVSDLTPLQLTGRKAEYITGTAKLMAEGRLSKEKLLELGDIKAIEKELIKIRGIGPWTANYVLMRCLKDPAAFPIEDVGLHNAIKHLLQLERKPTIDEIRQLSARWGSWKSYATFYLWRVLY